MILIPLKEYIKANYKRSYHFANEIGKKPDTVSSWVKKGFMYYENNGVKQVLRVHLRLNDEKPVDERQEIFNVDDWMNIR